MSARFRARPEARSIATRLPQADEARVQDALAAAGGSPHGALSNLAAAIARLVVERSPEVLHEPVLGAVGQRIVAEVLRRRQREGAAG